MNRTTIRETLVAGALAMTAATGLLAVMSAATPRLPLAPLLSVWLLSSAAFRIATRWLRPQAAFLWILAFGPALAAALYAEQLIARQTAVLAVGACIVWIILHIRDTAPARGGRRHTSTRDVKERRP